MPPQLMALSEGPSILLDKPILLVGRHQECDIQIQSRKVSRRHCCIAQVNDHLVVRDLCSTNGIRINGIRVIEGCLKTGDELTIGNFRYEVRWSAQAGEMPAMPMPGPVPAAAPAPPNPRARTQHDPLESLDQVVALEESVPLPMGILLPNSAPPAMGIPDHPNDPADLPRGIFPKEEETKPKPPAVPPGS